MPNNAIFFPEETIPFPCPDERICTHPCCTECRIALEDITYVVDEREVKRGYCYQLIPPEPFEISTEVVEEKLALMRRAAVSPQIQHQGQVTGFSDVAKKQMQECVTAALIIHGKADQSANEHYTIPPPDLSDRKDCIRFLQILYQRLRRENSGRIHSESEAVNYILEEAGPKDLFYPECKLARTIKKNRNWEYSSFTTYCKSTPSPKPKNLRRAAKKRATQKKIRRDIELLT